MPVRVFDINAGLPLPLIAKDARLVVGPQAGARQAVMNWVRLEPGEANVPHSHPESEDTIYVLAGDGVVRDHDSGKEYPVVACSAIFVPAGVCHAISAGPAGMVSVGGPVPLDFGMLRALGLKL